MSTQKEIRERKKHWYGNNKEKQIASSRRWQENNRERYLKYKKEYYEKNREACIASVRACQIKRKIMQNNNQL
jgi:hypothetical protein